MHYCLIYSGGRNPMQKKVALVAFNGDPMCFIHVLLNALDMEQRGYDVKIIIEGAATKLLCQLPDEKTPFSRQYIEVKEKGLIDCVCQACAVKMESLDAVKAQKLPLCNEMTGHPSLAKYIDAGYEIITF